MKDFHTIMNRVGIVLGVLLLSQTLLGRDLYVDPDRGDDGANGLAPQAGPERSGPVKTIAKAVGLAQPGDTVHLTPRPTPYRDCVLLRERSGEPGKPITIDGHGVTITGADPLRPADWTDLGEGLYRSDTLYAALRGDDSVIQRVFFLFKGRMQRMGRTSKGAKAPFKKPEDLRPGEWTFQAGSNSFYVRIAAGESLADAAIEIPYRANGVAIRGKKNEHLVLRNLTVTHFLNDGYNLHQHSKHVRFENIAAFECGDDGFSAHEGCDCEVEGYRASGNSTGFANGFGSHVKLKTAYLAGNHANEILQMHDSTFEIRDTHVVTQAARPVVVRGNAGKGQICRGSLENVLIQCRADRAKPFEIGKDAVVRANHV
ncbi:MAG TPA: hypothetical protein PK082_08280, partial [Phycisphaerae bacterium]|nr:hypothetical protein [Phycisphaerae bacterium]